MKSEYRWEKSTTTNYMNVARVFPDLDPVCCGKIHWIALVILAREDVPQSARAEALRLAQTGTVVNKKLAETLVEQAHDETCEVDYDRLLNQAGRALKRAAQLLSAISASRPELSPDQTEFADDLLAHGRQLFGSLQRSPVAELARPQTIPVAELARVQTCGAGVSPAPVAELARVQTVPVAELVRVPANRENSNSSGISHGCTIIVPPTVQPVATAKPAAPSRRGFLAAVGSAFGALCVTPFKNATAAPVVSDPKPAASQVASATIAERGPSLVTTFQYDAQGRLVSVIESPDPPSKSSCSAHGEAVAAHKPLIVQPVARSAN